MRELICYAALCSPTPTDEIQTIIFAHTPHLTRLIMDNGIRMDWGAFQALAETAGASLVELSVSLIKQPDAADAASLAVFCRFTALRSLVWTDSSGVELPSSEAALGGFPALEFLHFKRGASYAIFTAMECVIAVA